MLIGYKTLIVGSMITVLGALQGLDWAALMPNDPTTAGWVVSALGIIMMVLRMFTNTSVMRTTSPAPSPNTIVERVLPK